MESLGGLPVNHMGVTGLLKDADGQVCGVEATDGLSGEIRHLRARTVINATGVFVDSILRLDNASARPLIAPSQGIHLVLDKSFSPGDTAIMVPHTDDGRVIFMVPWHGRVLVGTTDVALETADIALMNDDIRLVTISGKAGTGKTLLALAAALGCRQRYRQIYFARPVVPLSNKDLGYLPGDVQSKLDPYMQPLHDNLSVLEQHQQAIGNGDAKPARVRELIDNEKLVITPLSYIRGRSLVKVYFIIDESQNLTPHEVKTIITRAGEGTKVILTGDIFQIDHPYLDSRSNGLSYLIEKMQGQPLYAHINLEKGERSELAELASNLL